MNMEDWAKMKQKLLANMNAAIKIPKNLIMGVLVMKGVDYYEEILCLCCKKMWLIISKPNRDEEALITEPERIKSNDQ